MISSFCTFSIQSIHFLIFESKDEEKRNCPICVDEFSDNVLIKRLPCKHFFHKACITPWLKLHNTCPFCRREFQTDDKIYEKIRKKKARENGWDTDDEDENLFYI
jgi:hypothetical protein